MIVWIDAQLPPNLAPWLTQQFSVDAKAVRELGLRDAVDLDIFMAARKANAVVLSKDSDFFDLLETHGPPPRILWVTCGNTSNMRLRQIFLTAFPQALQFLEAGEQLVEIGDAW